MHDARAVGLSEPAPDLRGDVHRSRTAARAIANCDRALARLDDQARADDLIAKRALRDRKAQKRNVYWNFVANLESCLLKS